MTKIVQSIRCAVGRALWWFVEPIENERTRKRLEVLREIRGLTSTSESE